MYKQELDELIKNRQLPSSLLLYGDSYWREIYSKFIINKLGDKESMMKIYFDEYDYLKAKNYLSSSSLFGDINLIYLKSDKKIPKKEIDTFVEISFKNENSYFIFEFCGSDKVAKDISKSFTKNKNAGSVRFFTPNSFEAIEILKKKAQKISLEIDSYALSHLYRIHNEDLSLCVGELEKLKLIGTKINVEDIDRHIFGMGEINLDKFIELLLKKEDIKEDLYTLLENEAVDELRILNAVENFITTLLLFRLYIMSNGTYNVIDILGFPLPSYLAKQRAMLSAKFSLNHYKDILNHLLKCEYTLKTKTNLDKKSFLISTLIKLQTYL